MHILDQHAHSETIRRQFPAGTFTFNMVGCFAIGWVAATAEKYSTDQTSLMLLMATGFCGGFTTFSAFAMENVQLIKN
jgi:CrcB protein